MADYEIKEFELGFEDLVEELSKNIKDLCLFSFIVFMVY